MWHSCASHIPALTLTLHCSSPVGLVPILGSFSDPGLCNSLGLSPALVTCHPIYTCLALARYPPRSRVHLCIQPGLGTSLSDHRLPLPAPYVHTVQSHVSELLDIANF